MSTEKINEIFDIPAINKQVAEVIKKIQSVATTMETTVSKITACNRQIAASSNYEELTKAVAQFTKANNQHILQTKEMAQHQRAQIQLEQKLQASYLQTAKQIESVRQQVTEQTQAIKDSVKAQREQEKTQQTSAVSISEVIAQLKRQRDTVSELTAENKRLQDIAKSMDYNTQKAGIDQINTVITANTALIALNSDAYAKQKIDIGNYKTAVESLDTIIQSLGEEMQRIAGTGGQNSEEFQKLTAELQRVQAQTAEFTTRITELNDTSNNLKTELTGIQEQMYQMALAGKIGTEQYIQLSDRAVELTGAINGVNEQINNMEAPTTTFDSIMGGLTALAGGFEIYQGAMGLIGIQNEDFEKIQAKVQSAMAITNGLITITAALDKNSALMIGLKTAAQSQNIIVSKAAAAAQWALNAARSADPIFLMVAALIAGVTALALWAASTKEASEEQKRQNEVHNNAIDAYAKEKTQIEDLTAKIQAGTATREDQAKMIQILNDKYGENFTKGKSMQEMEKTFVNNAPAFVGAAMKRAEAQAAFELAVESQKQALETATKDVKEYVGGLERLMLTEKEEATLAEARRTKEVADLEKQVQHYLKIQTEKQQAEKETKQKSGELNEQERKDQEKSIQAGLKSIQAKVKAEVDAQSEILDNTKSSYKEKQLALDLYTQKQIQAVRIQRDAELNGTTNKDERALIAQKANEDILKIRKQGIHTREKIDEQEAQTLRQIADLKSQVTMAASQKIMDSERSTFEQKITAQEEYEQAQKDSIMRQAQAQMAGLDASSNQALLINNKLQADLTNIEEKGVKDREQIKQQETTKRIADLVIASDEKLSKIQSDADKEYAAAAKQYAKGELSEEQYQQEKLAIQRKYEEQMFQATIASMQERIDLLLPESQEKERLTKELNQKLVEYNKWKNDNEIADNEKAKNEKKQQDEEEKEKRLALTNFILETTSAALDATTELTNAVFDRKIQQVDAEIAKVDEQKEHDLAVVEEMNISDEEKAERKKAIEAKAEAEKEKLEKKKQKLQLQQAKADKANAMIQVAMNTALAVMRIWADVPKVDFGVSTGVLSGIAIAMGAMQLAAIAAQPLPQYAEGTSDHPGGLAIVGDGGRKELVKTQNGYFVTPDTPTLMDLPKHAQVLPDFNMALQNLSFSPVIRDDAPNYNTRIEAEIIELRKAVNDVTEAVKSNRPQFNVNLDKNGLWETYERQKGRTKYINERLNINR